MSLTSELYVQACLAELAWQEGHTTSLNAMIAIALVQANRVRAGWEEGSWLAVIVQQKLRWSSWYPGYKEVHYSLQPDTRDPEFLALLSEIDAIYNGGIDHLTDGALWYAKPFLTDPIGWFQKVIVEQPGKHPRIAEIGGIVFYGGSLQP